MKTGQQFVQVGLSDLKTQSDTSSEKPELRLAFLAVAECGLRIYDAYDKRSVTGGYSTTQRLFAHFRLAGGAT